MCPRLSTTPQNRIDLSSAIMLVGRYKSSGSSDILEGNLTAELVSTTDVIKKWQSLNIMLRMKMTPPWEVVRSQKQ